MPSGSMNPARSLRLIRFVYQWYGSLPQIRIDREQADHLPVLPNFDAVLQGFEEDRIVLWQPLDEGK